MRPKSIPHADGLPWLGHMREMAADPAAFMVQLALTHGPLVRFTLMGEQFVLLSDPMMIHDVLVTKANMFPKDDRDLTIMGSLMGYGLLTTNGAQHRTYRKLAQPAFHAKRIVTYGEAMTRYAEATVAEWHGGEIRDINAEMLRTTMYIVAKTLFNTERDAMAGGADAIGEAIHQLQKIADYDFTWSGVIPQWWPNRANRTRNVARQQLYGLIEGMIAERRTAAIGGEVQDQGDLLSMLLLAEDEDGRRLNDREVRDEAINLFVAGHETTSNALTWTWYLLSQHPTVEAKLHAELDRVLDGRTPTLADLEELPYTAQVIKESMRLYPPAWVLNTRLAKEDVILSNETERYHVPKGTKLFIAPYVMHRLPQYFATPAQFRPERFTPEFEKSLPRFAYMPFGGGPRICIGNAFAMMEAQLVLATIAQQYALRLAPDAKVEPEPLITLTAKHGMKMQLIKRTQESGSSQTTPSAEPLPATTQPVFA
ncbi:MAG: cytochrome P450 [Caldilineaceae bacterium]|nr:cytochrome P450 [Caldilineaceae bacterium]